MALWYKLVTDKTYETADIVTEFLDIWLQTRKAEDIDPGELAGVIDTIYEFQSPSAITDETFDTMDALAALLGTQLDSRESEDINPRVLAEIANSIYYPRISPPSPGCWALIEVRPTEIRDYITIYVDADGNQKKMITKKDERLMKQYVKLLNMGYEPTPIIIAGAIDDDTKEEGIILIDGRHRTYAAIANGVSVIRAYIPKADLPKMDKAMIKAEPAQAQNTLASS